MKQLLNQRIIELLNLDNNSEYTILDFGCGKGELLGELRNHVSHNSILIGTNSINESHDYASEHFHGIDFKVQKFVDGFNFSNNSFDIILSVDTLECIPDKQKLLEELCRILKPRGRVLFAHWDWDTQVWNSEYKDLIRNFTHKFADWEQGWMDACDGMMGRKLWGFFQSSGRFRGQAEIFNIIETKFEEGSFGYDRMMDLNALVEKGVIRSEDHLKIINEMKELNENEEYFYSLSSYIYYGEMIK